MKVQRAGRFVKMHVGPERRSILHQSRCSSDLHRLFLTSMTRTTQSTKPLTRFPKPPWHRARPQRPRPLPPPRHECSISTARQRLDVAESLWHTRVGVTGTHVAIFWLTARPGQTFGSGDFAYPWLLAVPAGSLSSSTCILSFLGSKLT